MKKSAFRILCVSLAAISLCALLFLVLWSLARAAFPCPYRSKVLSSGVEEKLAYAVMKAESGFDEDARSKAGAVGLMQLMPATAEFVCELIEIPFEPERLTDGEYNAMLGCAYLQYLFGRFECEQTVLCAYNAGEGTVAEWLNNADYSSDGKNLDKIPYAETAEYVKKVARYKKFYSILY
ncbi:MAG: lytic transglycosylase domain-containing protein [Clostridia bacterium]|nr:lytic transglycosylase domain-containing protein [Clostridia bacterium]